MNKFFTFTTNLSPYAKWVLIRLITGRVIGNKLSKADFLKLGCTHNKFVKVIEELQKINTILKLEVESFKRGRPALSYSFIYNCPNKIDKLIPNEMLTKLEGLKLRVPIKLVWSFFALNQDEFGHVENFSVPTIANACGLEPTEVKTAITKLIEQNFIIQITKGCTYKKSDLITHYRHQDLTKRPSAYLVSSQHALGEFNLISSGIKINFNSLLNIAEADMGLYISNVIESFPSTKSFNLSNHIQRLLSDHLMTEHMYNAFKIYLDMQPENVLDNLRSALFLLLYKFLKSLPFNQQKSLSIIHVSNTLFGTRDVFNMNSNLYYLCSFITSYINLFSHSFLYCNFFGSQRLTLRSIQAYRKQLPNIKIDIIIKSDGLFITNCFSSDSCGVGVFYYASFEKPR